MDEVLVETPIDILINSKPLVNIVCLPKDLQDLAVGFLFSVGLIDSVNEVKDEGKYLFASASARLSSVRVQSCSSGIELK